MTQVFEELVNYMLTKNKTRDPYYVVEMFNQSTNGWEPFVTNGARVYKNIGSVTKMLNQEIAGVLTEVKWFAENPQHWNKPCCPIPSLTHEVMTNTDLQNLKCYYAEKPQRDRMKKIVDELIKNNLLRIVEI